MLEKLVLQRTEHLRKLHAALSDFTGAPQNEKGGREDAKHNKCDDANECGPSHPHDLCERARETSTMAAKERSEDSDVAREVARPSGTSAESGTTNELTREHACAATFGSGAGLAAPGILPQHADQSTEDTKRVQELDSLKAPAGPDEGPFVTAHQVGLHGGKASQGPSSSGEPEASGALSERRSSTSEAESGVFVRETPGAASGADLGMVDAEAERSALRAELSGVRQMIGSLRKLRCSVQAFHSPSVRSPCDSHASSDLLDLTLAMGLHVRCLLRSQPLW
jgi:hypothetical protein